MKNPKRHDGLFLTDIATGKSRIIASIRDIYERAVPSIALDHPKRYEYYCFQIRWNPQGTRVMAFLRWADPTGKTPVRLLTPVRSLLPISARGWKERGKRVISPLSLVTASASEWTRHHSLALSATTEDTHALIPP